MISILKSWYERHFSDPQVIILALLLLVFAFVSLTFGNILAPVIAAIVISYVLEGAVGKLQAIGVPRLLSVIIVFVIFIFTVLLLSFGILPLIVNQLIQLVKEFPNMIGAGQKLLMELPQQYPLISEKQIADVMSFINTEIASVGQRVLSMSLSSVIDVFTLMVYLVVVPLLIFFFLQDKDNIINWLKRFLPNDMGLASKVWHEVDIKIGNYVRGKIIEIVVVGFATYIPLAIMGMDYAALLSLLVGLSVIIPFVGAVAVSIPVVLIAFFQWGFTTDFVTLIVAYSVVQFLDGNLLVPLLFSEVVNIHPSAIIIAVLVFGGLWGVWGVFFAIPLATLVQAVINAWPVIVDNESETLP
ncbi:MAG: AI-2E family transporter [Gammaproteobacteria bacterium]|nr:AI-2E family transporter [Gammaproteobacteria bacterium]